MEEKNKKDTIEIKEEMSKEVDKVMVEKNKKDTMEIKEEMSKEVNKVVVEKNKKDTVEIKEEMSKEVNKVVVEKNKDTETSVEKVTKEEGGNRSKFRKRGFNRGRRGGDQPRSEFETRVLSARRVARVVAGGRRFSLSVAVVAGNKKGKVGIGIGKGPDMAIAIEKAQNQARKNVVSIPLTEENGIPCEEVGKFCASVVQLRPSKGFVAGGAVRTIAELGGIQNLNAKILSRSKSHLNNAKATLKALDMMN